LAAFGIGTPRTSVRSLGGLAANATLPGGLVRDFGEGGPLEQDVHTRQVEDTGFWNHAERSVPVEGGWRAQVAEARERGSVMLVRRSVSDMPGLERACSPLEEIRLAVVFLLSRDEHCARGQDNGGNSNQGPHSDNPYAGGPSPRGWCYHGRGTLATAAGDHRYDGLHQHNASARTSQGLAALRDFNPAYVGSGSGRAKTGREQLQQTNVRHCCYSITSSARASKVGGNSSPSALAVLRLITNSYLVGACTGKSAGLSPLRMRST
jgi:hypothetical protein